MNDVMVHQHPHQPTALLLAQSVPILRLGSRALRRADFVVHEAISTAMAAALLHQRRFDLFVCDLTAAHPSFLRLLADYTPLLRARGTQVVVIGSPERLGAHCDAGAVHQFVSRTVLTHDLLHLSRRWHTSPTAPAPA